jgi:hypothetical protein
MLVLKNDVEIFGARHGLFSTCGPEGELQPYNSPCCQTGAQLAAVNCQSNPQGV